MNKWEQIPPQYIPKVPIINTNDEILNIDCETNIEERIQDWYNKMSAQIQLTNELKELSPIELLNFIIHKTSGNVFRYLESWTVEERAMVASIDAITTFESIVGKIVQEFTGRNPKVEVSNELFREIAFWHITNLKICNMYYLEPFICEFSEQYYKLSASQKKIALDMFFNKLPESVATRIKDDYNTRDKSKIEDSLGARITEVKTWMKSECLKEKARREAHVKLYCKIQSNQVGRYGCEKPKK
ncbi:uncharacterized protein [Rutidosis leptorrhynchoides]|uniref:uncharacterized protein n=1 Tax=Rutidosis leptorrhynchoides TaxID=125765 RepID=UPI003A990893